MMSFEHFMQQPVKNGFYRGMLRFSYINCVLKMEGVGKARQIINGLYGGWNERCKPSQDEVSAAQKYILNILTV